MRWKVVGLVLVATFLLFGVLLAGEIYDIQRASADLLQLGNTQTIQPSSAETDEVILSLSSGLEEVEPGQEVVYTIFYQAKKEIKKARIVAALGVTERNAYPTYSWDLNDLKAGASGYFSVPVEVKKGEINSVVSRVTISKLEKPTWWLKEKRKILATVDDVDKLSVN